MRRRIVIVLIVISQVALFASCGKKWKKTSATYFEVELITPTHESSVIEVNGGSIYLDKFKFEGVRKQGSDVTFEDDFSEQNEAAVIDIMTSTVTPLMTYDIPQGTYSEIKTSLEFGHGPNGESMRIEGVYLNDEEASTHPFTLILDDEFVSEITANSIDGENEIVIVAEDLTGASIKIDIEEWFALVPEEALKQAFASSSKNLIVISRSENAEIYTAIANRVGIGNKTIFNP